MELAREPIATYEELRARRKGGAPFPVRVVLFRPVLLPESDHEWSCIVSVEPLWTEPFKIFGAGSFQALCLGAQHAVQMLATFAEQEGTLEYSDGEPFDSAVFGFRLFGDRRTPEESRMFAAHYRPGQTGPHEL